jgi:hypothetical protein
VEGRFARAAEALEERGDLAGAAEAWARADAAGQQPLPLRPLPLPEAATRAWCDGGRPARLARRAGRPSTRRKTPTLSAARVRALVCSARAAEDDGRFRDAGAAWKQLEDPEQVLRCRVTDLERAGDLAGAARLLEARERYETAAARWATAGDEQAAARCRALLQERRGALEEAAGAWDALGDATRAARCRAHQRFRDGAYDQAALFYDAAGDPGMAATARILGAKLRMDYEAARHAMVQAGMEDVFGDMLADRKRWLAEARSWAAAEARARERERRRRAPVPVAAGHASDGAPSGDLQRSPAPVLSAPPARSAGEPADDLAGATLDTVRRHPGLTAEGIARVIGISTAGAKPQLAALTAAGRLRKEGRTRGTRYYPV